MLYTSKLTILFESPFWIGLYERMDGSQYEVSRMVFGAEPKDNEVYAFLLQNWSKLKFSPSVYIDRVEYHRINPKRMQRKIQKQTQIKQIGTKAQQALQLQREQGKIERKAQMRRDKEEEKERQYLLRKEKKKSKHRGR